MPPATRNPRIPAIGLLRKQCPISNPTPEQKLWWAVVWRSAADLAYGHESLALDALEFLRSTGQWLTITLFGYEATAYRREVLHLIQKRKKPISIKMG